MDSIMLQIEEREASVLVQDLPIVKGDIVLITQMLQNLISNAIKFCDEDAPSVSISARSSEEEVILCVQDNGIGIGPADCDRIFLPFQRLHGRNKYAGNGIGLAICRKTVARHRGRIWVESEPGQGSRFFVALRKYEPSRKVATEPIAVPATV
jgi:signal transduction histidine kinase